MELSPCCTRFVYVLQCLPLLRDSNREVLLTLLDFPSLVQGKNFIQNTRSPGFWSDRADLLVQLFLWYYHRSKAQFIPDHCLMIVNRKALHPDFLLSPLPFCPSIPKNGDFPFYLQIWNEYMRPRSQWWMQYTHKAVTKHTVICLCMKQSQMCSSGMI